MDQPTPEVGKVIAEIAAGIGFKAELTNAEWGTRFAAKLYETGHEEAIKYVMADGAEGYRSHYLSTTRGRAQRASSRLLQGDVTVEAMGVYVARQLAFEVLAPGTPPVPLRYATHDLIARAYLDSDRRLQGHMKNNALLKRAMDATEPYPDRPLGELIEEGLVDAAVLVGGPEEAAA